MTRRCLSESGWLSSRNPRRMLTSLQAIFRLSTNHLSRKLRLYACAVCRQELKLHTDDRSPQAVDVAEQFADEIVSMARLLGARKMLKSPWPPDQENYYVLYRAAYHSTDRDAMKAAHLVSQDPGSVGNERQSELLRDILGNPFHPLPLLEPSLLTANGGLVVHLARAAYEERQMPSGVIDNDRLAVLADALEEVGCTCGDILLHLRQQGAVHVRGCFAVDWILGKS